MNVPHNTAIVDLDNYVELVNFKKSITEGKILVTVYDQDIGDKVVSFFTQEQVIDKLVKEVNELKEKIKSIKNESI